MGNRQLITPTADPAPPSSTCQGPRCETPRPKLPPHDTTPEPPASDTHNKPQPVTQHLFHTTHLGRPDRVQPESLWDNRLRAHPAPPEVVKTRPVRSGWVVGCSRVVEEGHGPALLTIRR